MFYNLLRFFFIFYFIYRERICAALDEAADHSSSENRSAASIARATLQNPPQDGQEQGQTDATATGNSSNKSNHSARSLLKSASISASKCIVPKKIADSEVNALCMSCNLHALLFENPVWNISTKIFRGLSWHMYWHVTLHSSGGAHHEHPMVETRLLLILCPCVC